MTVPEGVSALRHFCTSNFITGTEVFFDDFVPRNRPLFSDELEKQKLILCLKAHSAKRLHGSYWAWPTAFLARNGYSELLDRFGSDDAVIRYYGDLTGDHIYSRWVDEYALCSELGAASYTFHLIDYAPIDGLWDFSLKPNEIRQAMLFVLETFLNALADKGLLTSDSPVVEVENAGWGLEYGVQTAEDFAILFTKLNDTYGKVRIGWDINHLLHAIGYDKLSGAARFFLPEDEINEHMRALERSFRTSQREFVHAWIEHNLLHPSTINKVNSVHLSDCALKSTEYFRRGRLAEPFASDIASIPDMDGKERYGLKFVLDYYDSHIPLGSGVLSGCLMRKMLVRLASQNPGFVLLHELKNADNLPSALRVQLDTLGK